MTAKYFRNTKTGKLVFRKSFEFSVNKDTIVFAVAHQLSSVGKMNEINSLTHKDFEEKTLFYIENYGLYKLQDLDMEQISYDNNDANEIIKEVSNAFDKAFKGRSKEPKLKAAYYVDANELKDVLIVEKLFLYNTVEELNNIRPSTYKEIISLYQENIYRSGTYGLNRISIDDALYGKKQDMIDKIEEQANAMVRRAMPRLYDKKGEA